MKQKQRKPSRLIDSRLHDSACVRLRNINRSRRRDDRKCFQSVQNRLKHGYSHIVVIINIIIGLMKNIMSFVWCNHT